LARCDKLGPLISGRFRQVLRAEEPVDRRHRGRKNRAQVVAGQAEPAREDGTRDLPSQKAFALLYCEGNKIGATNFSRMKQSLMYKSQIGIGGKIPNWDWRQNPKRKNLKLLQYSGKQRHLFPPHPAKLGEGEEAFPPHPALLLGKWLYWHPILN
jgi:hypothetical protein